MIPVLDPTRRWQCPNCDQQAVTRNPQPHTEMHHCKSLAGLVAPMVEVHGVELDRRSVRIRAVEREDYVGDEIVRTDANGRPMMAVITDRADGSNDCHAFAGCAKGQLSL